MRLVVLRICILLASEVGISQSSGGRTPSAMTRHAAATVVQTVAFTGKPSSVDSWKFTSTDRITNQGRLMPNHTGRDSGCTVQAHPEDGGARRHSYRIITTSSSQSDSPFAKGSE